MIQISSVNIEYVQEAALECLHLRVPAGCIADQVALPVPFAHFHNPVPCARVQSVLVVNSVEPVGQRDTYVPRSENGL